jgi:hypothetical protein
MRPAASGTCGVIGKVVDLESSQLSNLVRFFGFNGNYGCYACLDFQAWNKSVFLSRTAIVFPARLSSMEQLSVLSALSHGS